MYEQVYGIGRVCEMGHRGIGRRGLASGIRPVRGEKGEERVCRIGPRSIGHRALGVE